ncbi:unnamed protein product [Owenia fusiformis]|uniref:G-protein coupled receptors family 1 profile domain-containing protein n=1 Tax=Owenia fusiformis TaxID=6347 RepID=A0A8S4PI95_OWEFU|nr:unnamed protein product [Owenia fusiformis]
MCRRPPMNSTNKTGDFDPSVYPELKIAGIINFYWPLVLLGVGIPGNLIVIGVSCLKHHRNNSYIHYMGALAVFDTIGLLVSGLLRWLLQNIENCKQSNESCKWGKYISITNYGCSVYIIIAMTFDRYLAVTSPMNVTRYSSISRTWKAIIGIVVVMTAFNIPFHVYSNKVTNKMTGIAICDTFASEDLLAKVYPWLSMALTAILPCVVLVALNAKIVRTLSQASRPDKLKDMGDTLHRFRSYQARQVTRMLVAVSIAFIVLTSPFYIWEVMGTFIYTENNAWSKASRLLVNKTTVMIWLSNNAVNFYIYALTGQKFRRDLKSLFCRGNRENLPRNMKNAFGMRIWKVPQKAIDHEITYM